MAIVQVSRITQRKGLSDNIPQLAGAEFGWVIDERRLFIGNGTLQEGAPAVGNTEILTQYSDIFAIAGLYTYRGEAGGYTVQTGATSGDPVQRTLQAKLDDMASVKDFGATGDGVTDDTDAINRALFQLLCRENNTQTRRSLFFPAGVYRITDSINVPPFVKIYGEGSDSSVFKLDVSGDSAFGPCVVRTADSLQQTGVNIGNNGASAPQNVEFYDVGFQSHEITDLVLIENAEEIAFYNCGFRGPFTQTQIENTPGTVTSADIACVRFGSTTALITNSIKFDGCHFQGCTYAFDADEEIQGITVMNSKLDTLYQGVLLGTGTPINGGPVGFRIMHCLFDNIAQEAVIIQNVANNMTGYNIFLDVATNFQGGDQTATAPIIVLAADNNVSVGDMFERGEAENAVEPRIDVGSFRVFALDKGERYKFGVYQRNAGQEEDLDLTNAPATIFTVDAAQMLGFTVQYRYRDEITGAGRFGTLTVMSADTVDSTGALSYVDEFSENNPTGLVLDVVQAGTSIIVQYVLPTASGFNGGPFRYSVSNLG